MRSKNTTPAEPTLDELIGQWEALLAARGVTPESEDALRALPNEMARERLTTAISRLSGASR